MGEVAARMVAGADPGRAAAYYSELQASVDPASLAAAIAFRLDPLLAEGRDDVEKCRQLLVEAEERLRRLEELAAAAQAIAIGAPTDDAVVLRGRSIVEHAITAAGEHGRTELHYTEWYELLRRDGYIVAGEKPLDTFLVALTRHPRVESAGARSGVYRIVEVAGMTE